MSDVSSKNYRGDNVDKWSSSGLTLNVNYNFKNQNIANIQCQHANIECWLKPQFKIIWY